MEKRMERKQRTRAEAAKRRAWIPWPSGGGGPVECVRRKSADFKWPLLPTLPYPPLFRVRCCTPLLRLGPLGAN